MNINSKNIKRTYIAPEVAMIKLDNEISLALQSTPPKGPGESYAPEHFNQNNMNNALKA